MSSHVAAVLLVHHYPTAVSGSMREYARWQRNMWGAVPAMICDCHTAGYGDDECFDIRLLRAVSRLSEAEIMGVR